ncbi:MAG: DUF4411 family protein [Candidatus Binataceae bacterium]
MKYSIDTSAILDGWTRFYPPRTFPSLWKKVEGLITAGELRATDEVLRELERKDDEVYAWAKGTALFLPVDGPIQGAVAAILAAHQRLVDTRRNRSSADPFVIALAQINSLVVVTGEHPTNNLQKPNIPDVCLALGIRCINLLGLFQAENWQV